MSGVTAVVSRLSVGAELREARTKAGLTQAALSRGMRDAGLPMDTSAISRVESGIRELEYREALLLRHLIGFGVEHADMQTFREAAAFRRMREAMDEAVVS